MKLSELIAKLQEIDKTVPFDSDIVTHGGVYPADLVKVFHEPPHTYLIFDDYGQSEEQ